MNDNLRHEGKNITLYVFLYLLVVLSITLYPIALFALGEYIVLALVYLFPFFYGYFYKIINNHEMSDSLRSKITYWQIICLFATAIVTLRNYLPITYSITTLVINVIGGFLGFILLWLIIYGLLGKSRFKVLALLILIWFLMPYFEKALEHIDKIYEKSFEQSLERIKNRKNKNITLPLHPCVSSQPSPLRASAGPAG